MIELLPSIMNHSMTSIKPWSLIAIQLLMLIEIKEDLAGST
jgi:hypothetical protein